LQDNRVQIGVIASERQAINALLGALERDGRIPYRFADSYWNARGGSWTDGGAFIFSIPYVDGARELTCTDKFGRKVMVKKVVGDSPSSPEEASPIGALKGCFANQDVDGAFDSFAKYMAGAELGRCTELLDGILAFSRGGDGEKEFSVRLATMLFDRRYNTGAKKRAQLLHHIDSCIGSMLSSVRGFDVGEGRLRRVDSGSREKLRPPRGLEGALVIDSADFTSEGDDSLARFVVSSYKLGWRKVVLYGVKGQRFIGSGLGPRSNGLRIDVYGDSGDYLASGLDGASVHVHESAQDQVANIMGSGELVVHGDVGQTFMYSSKGGEAFVLGNAAGRPLINAVGSPRVVINGTCLDYLAESFMAGDYLNGGGFVILNGIGVEDGEIVGIDTPYPGGNLFSLASGGAIFIRDPRRKVEENQLLGGKMMDIDEVDWRLIDPMLERNREHFGIRVEDLLKVDGVVRKPNEVYRKVVALERPKELE
jgi:glutamate synthase domain-containing protein 3